MWGHPENKNGAWGATVDHFISRGTECIVVDDGVFHLIPSPWTSISNCALQTEGHTDWLFLCWQIIQVFTELIIMYFPETIYCDYDSFSRWDITLRTTSQVVTYVPRREE